MRVVEVDADGHGRGRARGRKEHLGDRPSAIQAGVRYSDGERVSLLLILLGIVVVEDNGSEERWFPFKRRR